MPSPVESATEVGGAELGHAHPVQSIRIDDVTCTSAMTSRGRRSATMNNEMHAQSSTTAFPIISRVSQPAIVADMGFTPQQFTWLQEVNRCLNPHRRHHWSD